MANVDLEELEKALRSYGVGEDAAYTEDEIQDILTKAKADMPVEDPGEYEEKPEDGGEKEEKEEKEDDELVKKAMTEKIDDLKEQLKKAVTEFEDKYGKLPETSTPSACLTKSLDVDFLSADFEKSLDSRIQTLDESLQARLQEISKSFEDSLSEIRKTVDEIADAPIMMKGLTHNYNFIEKGGERVDENGKRHVSLRNRKHVEEVFTKAIESDMSDSDRKILSDEFSSFYISKKAPSLEALDIVKKAIDIEFDI